MEMIRAIQQYKEFFWTTFFPAFCLVCFSYMFWTQRKISKELNVGFWSLGSENFPLSLWKRRALLLRGALCISTAMYLIFDLNWDNSTSILQCLASIIIFLSVLLGSVLSYQSQIKRISGR
jgi:hypothetical protein